MTIRRIEDGRIKRPHVRTKFLIAQELGVEVIHLWPV
jgi:lambda repressor-like predicted transcriptional regulator